MPSRKPEIQALMETAHEALERMLADESAGEADIANVLRFCQHFTKVMGEAGYVLDDTADTSVQPSLCAQRGPAHVPDAHGAVVGPRRGTA